jgi:hypothetical protein
VPTADCEHDELEVATDVDRLDGPDGTFTVARVSVRCDGCGTLFSWRGLNSGVSNPYEPVTTADGYELRAPIVPRAGGVVVVLAFAGIEHELKEA